MHTQGQDDDRQQLIETKLAYVEDLVQSLNEIVAGQQRELSSLHVRVRELAQLVRDRDQRDAGPDAASDQRPPHW